MRLHTNDSDSKTCFDGPNVVIFNVSSEPEGGRGRTANDPRASSLISQSIFRTEAVEADLYFRIKRTHMLRHSLRRVTVLTVAEVHLPDM